MNEKPSDFPFPLRFIEVEGSKMHYVGEGNISKRSRTPNRHEVMEGKRACVLTTSDGILRL